MMTSFPDATATPLDDGRAFNGNAMNCDTADALLNDIRMRKLEQRHHRRSSSLKGFKGFFKKDSGAKRERAGAKASDKATTSSNKLSGEYGRSSLPEGHRKSGSWDLKNTQSFESDTSSVSSTDAVYHGGNEDSLDMGYVVEIDDQASSVGNRGGTTPDSLFYSDRKAARNSSDVTFLMSVPFGSEFV